MAKNISENNFIVSLDIGTTKIVTIVGYRNENGLIDVLSWGKGDSTGVEFGEIINIFRTVAGIKMSKQNAINQSQIDIDDLPVYVGVAGHHIKTSKYKHFLYRYGNDEPIQQNEIDKLRQEVELVNLNPGETLIDVIPQSYMIDNTREMTDPVGVLGHTVMGTYQLITGKEAEINKIKRCGSDANMKFKEIILEPIASAISCLTEEEKQEGVALIDIGGGTTDLIIYANGSPVFTKVIAIGGNIITSDIATVCSIPKDTAEKLKIQHGTCIVNKSNQNNIITIPKQPTPVQISENYLAKIINARVECDIIGSVKAEIDNSGYADLVANRGIVLTGGGAQLKHLKELVQFKTGYNTRIGIPEQGFEKNIPSDLKKSMYATALGLLKYGAEVEGGPFVPFTTNNREKSKPTKEPVNDGWGVFDKIRKFLKERIEQVS
ncbi:MAG: cell division protein FtsA [Bacteroidales bacterium]|nr:cell division protein FtsA [Bacteroidales bacterium]MBR6333598.1 cell division protein FtsA [Bacteroidales bacterium]